MEVEELKLTNEWIEINVGTDDKPDPIAFYCSPLSAAQFLNLVPYFNPVSDRLSGDGALLATTYCVKGWRGLVRNGEDLPFDLNELREFFRPFKRHSILQRLAHEITERAALSEKERKN